ncbi:hypothetical protein Emed_003232 [Eimeria media]
MAKIYSPNEVVRRLRMHQPPCFGSIDDDVKEYSLFVTEHAERMNKVRDRILAKPHKRFRLAYINWNSLLLKPNTMQLLAAFLNPEEGLKVDDADGVAILLQENLKLEEPAEKLLLENIQYVLNLLSTEANWELPTVSYLDNLIGTQAKLLLRPNTQTLVMAMRKTYQPQSICQAAHALLLREKGFIGAAFDIPGMGKLAIAGAHLKGWDSRPFHTAMSQLTQQCGSPQLGLDSFTLGVVYGGDWNEHFHTQALNQLYTNIQEDPSRYPAFQKEEIHARQTASNLKMTELLLESLTEPLDIVENEYQPLLWSVDRLGRSVEVEGAPETLPAALRQHGFNFLSACYGAGITYKWKRGCRYPSGRPETGHSPFKMLKPCLDEKVLRSPRGAGYLDRVAVRVPSASTEVLNGLLEKEVEGELLVPSKFASIRKGAVVYDLRSDHIMVANLIEFLAVD